MKILSTVSTCAAVLTMFAMSTSRSSATTIFIDFGTGSSPVQSGFTAQTSSSGIYSTPAGDITVDSSGSFFNRSAALSYEDAALMGDFTFLNSFGTLTLTIDGPGIAASTNYDIRFYSYDSQHTNGGGTVTYTGVSGTSGSTSIAYSNANQNDPGFALSNSSLATFTSNTSGELVFDVTGTTEGPRVSGMEITVIPEPSSLALLGLAGMALFIRRRR